MWDIISRMFDSTGFPPRWHCGLWTNELGWLHIGSDLAVFGAYTAIPCVLAFLVLPQARVPFPASSGFLWRSSSLVDSATSLKQLSSGNPCTGLPGW